MQPRTRMIRLLPLFLLGYFFSCEKPTEPKTDPEPDTTSHSFIWDIDTIGYRNIMLSDGVIINENDMWVVGDIYPDSTSYYDAIHYGIVHWNGQKWIPEIVMARGYPDNEQIKEASVIRGIAYTNDNQLFISTGLLLMVKSGNEWIERAQDIIDGKGFLRIWGNESDNLYIYGTNGGLYHFNGTILQLIPTNTNLDIIDLHGDYNQESKEYELLALASSDFEGTSIFKITKQIAIPQSTKGIDDSPNYTIWFSKGKNFQIAGFNLYHKNLLSDESWIKHGNDPNPLLTVIDINGWGNNDLFMLQSSANILHFNGSTWANFKDKLGITNSSFYKVIIRDKVVLILGMDTSTSKGLIIRGRRIL